VKAEDIAAASAKAPVVLALRGELKPGANPRASLRKGHAWKVATGASLPKGADTVVPVEEAAVEGKKVVVRRAVSKGEYVYGAGRDVKRGEPILRGNRTLRPQDLVLLASLNFEKVLVAAKPKVAIVPTGSELTDRVQGERGKIVESHSILLGRLVEAAGGIALHFPIVRDDPRSLVRQIRRAVRAADMVITMAGTSVGEPDLVDSAIDAAGSPGVLVHGVKVHRGRVMGFGVVSGKAIVMAPGPVQAALNSFIVFGYPLIRAHLGLGFETPPSIPATVVEDWQAPKYPDFEQIVYVRLATTEGRVEAAPSSGETERMSFLVAQDAYTRVPGGKASLRNGENVRVELLPGFARLS